MMSVLAPPYEVTPRTESRRTESTAGGGVTSETALVVGALARARMATRSAVLHTAGLASLAATGT